MSHLQRRGKKNTTAMLLDSPEVFVSEAAVAADVRDSLEASISVQADFVLLFLLFVVVDNFTCQVQFQR